MEEILKYFTDFTEKQLRQMAQLGPLYREWNEKINVISRKDIDALYEKHILHSLAIAVLFPFKDGAEVLDIGTGGGFPGIPLAVFFPEVRFFLADSIGKKIKVVQEVAEATGLENVTAWHGRAEEIKGKSFDFAVSRAVAPLGDLWKWSHLLIRKGQKCADFSNGLICLKGGDLEMEIKESGVEDKVQAWRVDDIFQEPAFEDKYIIYVPR